MQRPPEEELRLALGLDATHHESPFIGGQKFRLIGKDTGEKGQVIAGLL
jgi:hypothetical protein